MFQNVMRDGMQTLQKLSADDVLEALGLQRRRSFESYLVPTAALFAAGAVVGAATAVLLTPKTGPAMRKELIAGAKDLGQRIGQTANSVVQEVRDVLPSSAEEEPRTPRSAGSNTTHAARSKA
jgi:hypothetical protein